jgi:hypothetical protein
LAGQAWRQTSADVAWWRQLSRGLAEIRAPFRVNSPMTTQISNRDSMTLGKGESDVNFRTGSNRGMTMPELVRVYIKNVIMGFGLSAVFVSALLYLNVGNLWHLISTSNVGWMALVMLVFFNGVVFAGVQFAMTIMRMETRDDEPKGGNRVPVATNIPARVTVAAEAPRARRTLR